MSDYEKHMIHDMQFLSDYQGKPIISPPGEVKEIVYDDRDLVVLKYKNENYLLNVHLYRYLKDQSNIELLNTYDDDIFIHIPLEDMTPEFISVMRRVLDEAERNNNE